MIKSKSLKHSISLQIENLFQIWCQGKGQFSLQTGEVNDKDMFYFLLIRLTLLKSVFICDFPKMKIQSFVNCVSSLPGVIFIKKNKQHPLIRQVGERGPIWFWIDYWDPMRGSNEPVSLGGLHQEWPSL